MNTVTVVICTLPWASFSGGVADAFKPPLPMVYWLQSIANEVVLFMKHYMFNSESKVRVK